MVSVRYVAYNSKPEDFFIVPGFTPAHSPYIHIIIIGYEVFSVDNEKVIKERPFNWLIFKDIKVSVCVFYIKSPFSIIQEFLSVCTEFFSGGWSDNGRSDYFMLTGSIFPAFSGL